MEFIKYEKKDHWAQLTVSKPEALNALSTKVLEDLNSCLDQVEADTELRALIVTGDGEKAFVAGADIKEIHDLNPDEARAFAGFGQKVFQRFENLKVPVVAMVNGFALGGGLELALACDFIYASEKAKFGLPECTLGLMPGFGGSVRLARRIGPQRAKEITFSGGMLSADEAYKMGLVNRVFSPEALAEETQKLAQTLTQRAPLALAAIKKTIETTYGLSVSEAMAVEQKAFAELFNSQDCREGTKAFIEKRKPQFQGK